MPSPSTPVPAPDHEAAVHYRTRRAALAAEHAELDARDGALSRARGLAFLLTLGGGMYGLLHPRLEVGVGVALALAGFVWFVIQHAKLSTRQFELERRMRWCDAALARIAGEYKAGDDERHRLGEAHRPEGPSHTGDLDIFGPASLFEQLDTTQTPGGAARLAGWLVEAADAPTVRARQGAARELSTMAELREDLSVAGMRARKVDPDVGAFLAWTRAKPTGFETRNGVAAITAIAVVATLAALGLRPLLPPDWRGAWMGAVLLQLAIGLVVRRQTEDVLGPVAVKQTPLGRYHGLFGLLEGATFEDPTLRALQDRLTKGEASASDALGRLERLIGYASTRHNPLVALLANLTLSWDVWCARALERWRGAHGAQVEDWLDALAELEALAALGTYAHEHPDHSWPEVVAAGDGPGVLSARGLAHPLLGPDAAVPNDVTLDAAVRCLMVTGSNMSGKSTMLRSIGLATVMAQAGLVVRAKALRMTEARLITSIRVDDSLAAGVSHFYAEVQKLKAVVDAAAEEDDRAVLFLLDEVLHGTNSRERIIGAKAVVEHLVERGALGAVSSHDLGLVDLAESTAGQVRNVHFEDHIEGGEMRFDYTMKDGPVGTSNALRLMRQVGIDLPALNERLHPNVVNPPTP